MKHVWMLGLVAAAAAAQDTGWVALGNGTSMGLDGTAPAFHYSIADGMNSAMALDAPGGMAQMKQLQIRVRADHATGVAVLLSEKKPGGGNYVAWFWANALEWESVTLTAADFTPTDGPGDPLDADGKLDLDQVETICVMDLAQFFNALKQSGGASVLVDNAGGPHTLWIDGFTVSADAPAAPGRGVREWVTPGGMDLTVSAGDNPLGAQALVAQYQRQAGQFAILVRRESAQKPASTRRLAFDIASDQEATVVVSLEESVPGGGQGPRYTLPIFPPGGGEVFHVMLNLADFQGPDGAGPFDPAKWRSTVLMDVTNASGTAPGSNTLRIGNVRTLP